MCVCVVCVCRCVCIVAVRGQMHLHVAARKWLLWCTHAFVYSKQLTRFFFSSLASPRSVYNMLECKSCGETQLIVFYCAACDRAERARLSATPDREIELTGAKRFSVCRRNSDRQRRGFEKFGDNPPHPSTINDSFEVLILVCAVPHHYKTPLLTLSTTYYS